MISSKFPKSFRGARDLMVFYESLKVFQKFIEHHQVTSTPKTLQKLAWNHLTVFWLNFERNRRFLFLYIPSPNINSEQYEVWCRYNQDQLSRQSSSSNYISWSPLWIKYSERTHFLLFFSKTFRQVCRKKKWAKKSTKLSSASIHTYLPSIWYFVFYFLTPKFFSTFFWTKFEAYCLRSLTVIC